MFTHLYVFAILACSASVRAIDDRDGAPTDTVYLDDYSVEEVSTWLAQQKLDYAFADSFRQMQYDGDMLVHFLRPEDVDPTDFPRATKAHFKKLFNRIQAAAKPSSSSSSASSSSSDVNQQQQYEVGASGTARRRQLGSTNSAPAMSGSGIRIRSNESYITLGEQGDVTLRTFRIS